MLPFLKKKPQPGVMVQTRQADEDKQPDNTGLEACAQDLIDAVQSGDAKRVASALKAAHDICDTYSHEEGPHTNEEPSPHTYESQNQKAASNE